MKRLTQEKTIEKIGARFPLADFFGFDIVPYTSVVQFEADERILREGTAPEYLYYLIDGSAKLSLSHENGRVSLINFLRAPAFIGEMELVGAQCRANEVTAMTVCTCYAIHTAGCREALLQDAKFLRCLCRTLGRKACGNTYNYAQNQSYPLAVRLANFILVTARDGCYREKHTESSEFLGVTYRHFLYVLADFVKEGLLKKTEGGYLITDPAGLRRVARRGK